MDYENILVDTRDRIGIITLNRPKALNALSTPLTRELAHALDEFENRDDIDAVVLTGSERAFAAGADISEMQPKSFVETYGEDFITSTWERVATCRLPVVAAVSGFALGGGCELAMMCDIIVAAENAQFGQPEINLGIIPGAGGTQRMTRSIGKAKTMDLVLTGRMMDVEEAERAGLVSRIVPADKVMDEAISIAETISSKSRISVKMAKEAVNKAYETTLTEGVRFERRLFHSLFATDDQSEGMAAFLEKRKPKFTQS